MADDDVKVQPRLAPERPRGYAAPASPNLNQAAPTLDSRNNVKPISKDTSSPFARRDEGNNFQSFPQYNMLLVDQREPYEIVTAAGELDILSYSYFIIRSVGGSDFAISVPAPVVRQDINGDPILEARAITIDIEYTGAGKPAFTGVAYPDDTEPDWTSEAGFLDTVVLTWAERWLLRKSSFGYAI